MADLVPAEGPLLDQILDETYDIWNDGLSRPAYPRYYSAQRQTAWGRSHLRRFALVDATGVLASAKEYELAMELDGRRLRTLGIGAVFTQPAHRGRGHARDLLERLVDRATGDGYDLALLFSEIGTEFYSRLGFEPIPTADLLLTVAKSERYGAPATLVRAGDDRDVPAIVAMNAARAERCRFHLTRDGDLVQYAITKKRLLAGLGNAGAREVHFFAAEEGASAVAYVVITVRERTWTLEECGDRDPSGARVGAILQALLAREPAERRPTIRASLPPGFLPPQVAIGARTPQAEVMMCRPLTPAGRPIPPLSADDVQYWRSDLF